MQQAVSIPGTEMNQIEARLPSLFPVLFPGSFGSGQHLVVYEDIDTTQGRRGAHSPHAMSGGCRCVEEDAYIPGGIYSLEIFYRLLPECSVFIIRV